MTRAALIEKIDAGSDIMFTVMNKHYTVLTWHNDGIGIGEQFPNDGKLQFFETAEELVDKFKVDGKTLGSISDKVVITQYS